MTESTDLKVVVTGDLCADWNIAHVREVRSAVQEAREEEDKACVCNRRSGSVIMSDLIREVAHEVEKANGTRIVVVADDQPDIRPDDRRLHHYYQTWSLHPREDGDHHNYVWRVDEFLGVDRRVRSETTWPPVDDGNPPAEIVVLTDVGLGFRDEPERWPTALSTDGHQPYVIVKMHPPFATGPLWSRIQADHADRTIVVINVRDLRRTAGQVSRKLSWERSAQDVAWELLHNPRLNALARCAHVVVSFGPAGAVVMSNVTEGRDGTDVINSKCSLLFDPGVIEGEWERRHPGMMLGQTTVLTAGIARAVMQQPDHPDLEHGILSGLSAMRDLYIGGYDGRRTASEGTELTFPVDRVAAALSRAPDTAFDRARVRIPGMDSKDGDSAHGADIWTVLGDGPWELGMLAENVVRRGPETTLRGVPLGRFGDLVTCDRQEIENLRSIRALVEEYCNRRSDRPLSIAVFGPPGAGKSFGIKEVATTLPADIKDHSFDLSQFSSPSALVGALHQVRDLSFKGHIPLIFWEEFDSELDGKHLGWLRYFLSPMQDGSFQDGQLTHPIGRSIFAFVGGRYQTMDAFRGALTPEERRDVKQPDFISRLRGYVNVLGPNPSDLGRDGSQENDDQSATDRYYVIRRALLLRSMLLRDRPHLFRRNAVGELELYIDRGVLRALLETREYRHGARSMEAIIAMSVLTGNGRFEQSCLPSEQQLELHVDGRDFNNRVRQTGLLGDELDQIAEVCHELYQRAMKARGYSWGDVEDDERRLTSTLTSYGLLSPEMKEISHRIALDALDMLSRLGYVVHPATPQDKMDELSESDLECMAEVAHNALRAARERVLIQVGKAPAPGNPMYLPWEKTPKAQKMLDRDIAEQIPHALHAAEFAIKRMPTAIGVAAPGTGPAVGEECNEGSRGAVRRFRPLADLAKRARRAHIHSGAS